MWHEADKHRAASDLGQHPYRRHHRAFPQDDNRRHARHQQQRRAYNKGDAVHVNDT